MTGGQSHSTERLHALDLVRAGALLLGIYYHASMSMLPGAQAWQIRDVDHSAWIAGGTFILHSFRMTAFFLMAGFFGRMMLMRRGPAGFVKDRAKRIALPFVLFLIGLLAIYAVALEIGVAMGTVTLREGYSLWSNLEPSKVPLLHLWFLYVLLILYAAMLGLHWLAAVLDRQGAIRARIDAALALLLRWWALPVLLALPTAALLLGQPHWLEFWGVITPQRGFLPAIAPLAIYGLALGLGWLLHRQDEWLAMLRRQWLANMLVAIALSAVALRMAGTDIVPEPLFAGREQAFFALTYGGMMWFWTFALIGAALRFLNRPNPAIRYLADSSYWLYLVHMPLVVALQFAVMDWAFPAELKLLLILAVTLALLLASYELLVRHTALGALLNGRRIPRGTNRI